MCEDQAAANEPDFPETHKKVVLDYLQFKYVCVVFVLCCAVLCCAVLCMPGCSLPPVQSDRCVIDHMYMCMYLCVFICIACCLLDLGRHTTW